MGVLWASIFFESLVAGGGVSPLARLCPSSLASPTSLLLILFCRSVFVVHGIMRPTRGFALRAFQLKVERHESINRFGFAEDSKF